MSKRQHNLSSLTSLTFDDLIGFGLDALHTGLYEHDEAECDHIGSDSEVFEMDSELRMDPGSFSVVLDETLSKFESNSVCHDSIDPILKEQVIFRLGSTNPATIALYTVMMSQAATDSLCENNISLKSTLLQWINNGANVNVTESSGKHFGKNPLLISIFNNNLTAALNLIECQSDNGVDVESNVKLSFGTRIGLNVDYQDPILGNSALHYCVSKGFDTNEKISIANHGYPMTIGCVIEALVQKGADVNMQNANGDTPLHIAFLRRDINAISFLLANGADLEIFNFAGLSPASMLEATFEEAKAYLNTFAKFYILNKNQWDNNLREVTLMVDGKSKGKSGSRTTGFCLFSNSFSNHLAEATVNILCLTAGLAIEADANTVNRVIDVASTTAGLPTAKLSTPLTKPASRSLRR